MTARRCGGSRQQSWPDELGAKGTAAGLQVHDTCGSPQSPRVARRGAGADVRDLEELHSLAHVMNRTRRRDIGRFTIREPQTVSVDFTHEQRQLYDAVLSFRREVLLQHYDPQIVRLIIDTLERQAESCINAVGRAVGRILATGGFAAADLTDDPEAPDDLAPISSAALEQHGIS